MICPAPSGRCCVGALAGLQQPGAALPALAPGARVVARPGGPVVLIAPVAPVASFRPNREDRGGALRTAVVVRVERAAGASKAYALSASAARTAAALDRPAARRRAPSRARPRSPTAATRTRSACRGRARSTRRSAAGVDARGAHHRHADAAARDVARRLPRGHAVGEHRLDQIGARLARQPDGARALGQLVPADPAPVVLDLDDQPVGPSPPRAG